MHTHLRNDNFSKNNQWNALRVTVDEILQRVIFVNIYPNTEWGRLVTADKRLACNIPAGCKPTLRLPEHRAHWLTAG